ncbi:MAG: TraR/DksA C4-type zinc finger protein [Phycisphaerales bacterium]|nr:TraR/DksA C4-type zinc finger protein [Phycisphaerales bacterium]
MKGVSWPKKGKGGDGRRGTDEDGGDIDVTKIKSKLKKKDLDHYRDLLLQRRREILGLVENMEDEALRSRGGNLSTMPLHMADIGSDTFDQDFNLSLAEQERSVLGDIDAALTRIKTGTYGICQATGKPIPKARLDAKPHAKYTIEAARAIESGRRP